MEGDRRLFVALGTGLHLLLHGSTFKWSNQGEVNFNMCCGGSH
jgi:hypothetical protein